MYHTASWYLPMSLTRQAVLAEHHAKHALGGEGFPDLVVNALPDEVRKALPTQRMFGVMLRRTGLALKDIGRYQEALWYMDRARAIYQPLLAADANDTRAANDLMVTGENEAECYEERAEGVSWRNASIGGRTRQAP